MGRDIDEHRKTHYPLETYTCTCMQSKIEEQGIDIKMNIGKKEVVKVAGQDVLHIDNIN